MTWILELIDSRNETLARIEVTGRSPAHYLGRLIDEHFPADLRDALAEYNEVIEDNILSLVDPARARVAAFGIRARGIPGRGICTVLDLQVSPRKTVAIQVAPSDDVP